MRRKVCVWVTCQDSVGSLWVLLLQTVSDRGAIWQPITGWVESHETDLEGAVRELFEETGLTNFPLSDLEIPSKFHVKKKFYSGEVIENHYHAQLSERMRVTLDPSEHTDSRWFEINSVQDLLVYEEQRRALLLLLALK